MRLVDLTRRLAQLPALQSILSVPKRTLWRSIAPEARPVLFAAEYLRSPRKTLIVAASYERALAWQAKLELCGVPHDRITQLPSGTSALFEDAAPEHIALSDRLGALRNLVSDEPWVIIAAPQAALERTLPAEIIEEASIELRPGGEIDLVKFVRRLERIGYEPQDPVRLPGQFSRRGGILDLFATGHELPVRIELFGDEIESIRRFDPNTQRSIENVPILKLSPSRETIYTRDAGNTGLGDFREWIEQALQTEAATLGEEAAERLEQTIRHDLELLSQKTYFDRLDLYRPMLHPDSGCAIDLLGENGLLVIDEPLELETIVARSEDELGQALRARHERGEILRSTVGDFMLPPEHLNAYQNILVMSSMDAVPDWVEVGATHDVQAISLESYRGRADALSMTLRNYLREGFQVVFSTDQPNRAKAVLSAAEIFASEELDDEPGARLAIGNLGGGFVMPELRLAIVSDAELFGVARLKLPQRRFMEGAPIATVLDLKPGDYVVHINFGIGIFRGLVRKTVEGVDKEFLYVEYQAPDKLFVPADQLDRIQKYLNPGDEQPKLNRLTGQEWQKTLGKAKEEARAFARDLVKLYAQRKAVSRRSYGPDTPFQTEMESTFPWVETPGQIQAIKAVKRDLMQDHPMDRLVCGDVGFGKTEVAIRAAFKVAQDGRQVAVLCPTTILSEQHFRNFSERLGGFGTRLGLINRYTHTSDKKELLGRLREGGIDVLVGTHALLGTGIEWKNLGLVIIDEEQKFGVKQKEMLKELRGEVDVLTLSATPIPRTLSMALMDIRQMSLINDPPPGRLPIRTYVRPYSGEVVREAILRELARGGQVFYVYNRVESIGHIAEKLRKLVPTARIGVGHGQMNEKELEPIMVGFIKGEIDILLSTTIIENGIDISNANTLIVEQADRLGLSQLYQLRGRVGRSDRQAYAYFLYSGAFDATVQQLAMLPKSEDESPKKKKRTVTEGAVQRLQALQEFSSLGSGYSLAFRDLQIRGAGELLGAKQHGTMATVGYELYTQLINEAVATLKAGVDGTRGEGDDAKDPLAALEPLPAFEVPVVAFLPETYIKDQAQRLYYYQRMMTCREEKSLGEVQSEIEDRYGRPTLEVTQAFAIMAQRIWAKRLGFEKIDARQGRIAVSFRDRSSIPPRIFTLLGKRNRDCYFTQDKFIWPFTGAPIQAIERLLTTFDESLAEIEDARARLSGLS